MKLVDFGAQLLFKGSESFFALVKSIFFLRQCRVQGGYFSFQSAASLFGELEGLQIRRRVRFLFGDTFAQGFSLSTRTLQRVFALFDKAVTVGQFLLQRLDFAV